MRLKMNNTYWTRHKWAVGVSFLWKAKHSFCGSYHTPESVKWPLRKSCNSHANTQLCSMKVVCMNSSMRRVCVAAAEWREECDFLFLWKWPQQVCLNKQKYSAFVEKKAIGFSSAFYAKVHFLGCIAIASTTASISDSRIDLYEERNQLNAFLCRFKQTALVTNFKILKI